MEELELDELSLLLASPGTALEATAVGLCDSAAGAGSDFALAVKSVLLTFVVLAASAAVLLASSAVLMSASIWIASPPASSASRRHWWQNDDGFC